jgi:hypothetical protein
MKKFAFLFLLLLPSITFSQYQYGFMQEFFFERLPGAKAEAMGKAYSSIDGDLTTMFFNPAGTASIQGLELYGSSALPLYSLKEAKYNYLSIGCRVGKYLSIGFSRNHFTFGQKIYVPDAYGSFTLSFTPYDLNHTLNFSSQPIKNLLLGLNANYLIWNPINEKAGSFYTDFGAIKKFQFIQTETCRQSLNIGASISNFNFAKSKLKYDASIIKNDLPVITRFGVNYQFSFNSPSRTDSLTTLMIQALGEYQELLNCKYNSGLHTGVDIMILEIFALRAGYYTEKVFDYGYPNANNNKLNAFTYGFGVQLPFYKITRMPLNINFDITYLPQPSYSKTNTQWDSFTTYNFRLNWILNTNY